MLKNTINSFGSIAKFFHWTIAILIIGNITGGFLIKDLKILNYHKLIGLLVLFLAVFRLVFFIFSVKPALPSNIPKIEKLAAFSVKYVLFIIMFALPISGWIMATVYGIPPTIAGHAFPFPFIFFNSQTGNLAKLIHNSLAFIIIGVILMHIGGALKHHFVYKDHILKRMLPFNKDN